MVNYHRAAALLDELIGAVEWVHEDYEGIQAAGYVFQKQALDGIPDAGLSLLSRGRPLSSYQVILLSLEMLSRGLDMAKSEATS